MTTRTRTQGKKRPTAAEIRAMPMPPGIVADPVTSGLEEPYCVFMQDDDGTVSGIVHMLGPDGKRPIMRTYWPGHADWRWPPTRLARTAAQARWMLAERPEQMVAIPVSLVWEMHRGSTLGLTSPEPQ